MASVKVVNVCNAIMITQQIAQKNLLYLLSLWTNIKEIHKVGKWPLREPTTTGGTTSFLSLFSEFTSVVD